MAGQVSEANTGRSRQKQQKVTVSLEDKTNAAQKIQATHPASDFLSRQKQPMIFSSRNKAEKFLEVSRKPERLSTEDDMNILNSFVDKSQVLGTSMTTQIVDMETSTFQPGGTMQSSKGK